MCVKRLIDLVSGLTEKGNAQMHTLTKDLEKGSAIISLTSFEDDMSMMTIASQINDLKEFREGRGVMQCNTKDKSMLISVF